MMIQFNSIQFNRFNRMACGGIEDQEQLKFLRTLKWEYVGSSIVDAGQGFLFCRPSPENEIADLLEKQGMLPLDKIVG